MATLALHDGKTATGRRWRIGAHAAYMLKVMSLSMIAAWLFRSVLFAPYYIPSGSMMPLLREGDFFIASRWDYGISPRSFVGGAPSSPMIFASSPDRGDVIVLSPPNDAKTTYVKRVVGIAGDRIAMRSGVLHINGIAVSSHPIRDFIAPVGGDTNCVVVPDVVDQRTMTRSGRPGCRFGRAVETLPNGVSYPTLDIAPARTDYVDEFVVPAGMMAVMGDNRDNSLDSRVPVEAGGLGLLSTDRALGRMRAVIGSDAQGARFLGTRAFAAD